MPDHPALTVAVVTYNSAAHLPGLLASLGGGLDGVADWRLVVADNASTDATVDLVRHLAPDATVVAMGRNAGYAAGVNAAAAAAPPERALLILNPDIRLAEGSVAALLTALNAPATGITVPRLTDVQGHPARSLRREPSVRRALGEALLGGVRAGRLPAFGEVVTDERRYRHPGTADWASGAVMLVSRECLDVVGPWDESFFLYSEETDFALRARDAGFALRYTPHAAAVHAGGEAHTSPRLWSILALNRVRLFRRRHGRVHAAAFWAAVTLNEGLRALGGGTTHRAALRALLLGRA
jgi:GT2 family glycosyltransferase